MLERSPIIDRLPAPNPRRLALHATPAAKKRVRSGHPWIFADHLQKSPPGLAGDLAVLFDADDRYLAVGLYDPDSPIRLRVLWANEKKTIDAAFFEERIAAASGKREEIAKANTGYRVFHGENDGLPGLTIDRYERSYVIKIYTAAWLPHLRTVVDCVERLFLPERIVLRTSRGAAEATKAVTGGEESFVIAGPPLTDHVHFTENGLRFAADLLRGQKTGFFLDQRENRAAVEKISLGKDVLNVCAYSGGFSVYAARGGARRVMSLDMSRHALADAEMNFRLNASDPNVRAAAHEIHVADAFLGLERLARTGRRFDIVILDPPSFAQRKADVPRALSAYERLVRLGLALVQEGGTLLACSCSTPVGAEDFFGAVHGGAALAHREFTEIERTFHAPDHPIGFPEGAYLKALWARIGGRR